MMTHMPRRSVVLAVVFIAVVLVLSIGSLFVIWSITAKNIGPIDLDHLDLKTRLDELRGTLQTLIVVAGLFALAQAAAAAFNAGNFTKQAEDAIKRISDQARDAETRYPVYARVENLRREAYASLADIFGDTYFLNWSTPSFEKLSPLNRQKLLSVERLICIELLPHPGGSEEYVRDLRRLANFYASKHRYEADPSRAQPQWTDLERSEYYLTLAINAAGRDNFHLITDFGVLYMEYYFPPREDDAEKKFRESLEKHGDQQRAYFNLATLARKRKDWAKTIAHYQEALSYENWERTPINNMRSIIFYNQACAFARYSYEDANNQKDLEKKCINALIQASRDGGKVPRAVVEEDLCKSEGAFFGLSPQIQLQIRDMQLSQSDANSGDVSWKQIALEIRNKLFKQA